MRAVFSLSAQAFSVGGHERSDAKHLTGSRLLRAVDVDHRQVVGRRLDRVAVVVSVHDLVPVGGRAPSRREWRRLERHAHPGPLPEGERLQRPLPWRWSDRLRCGWRAPGRVLRPRSCGRSACPAARTAPPSPFTRSLLARSVPARACASVQPRPIPCAAPVMSAFLRASVPGGLAWPARLTARRDAGAGGGDGSRAGRGWPR